MGEIVEATAEKEVSQKASGKIIIYNNYSTVSQRLINNTRFEANSGKIYRINSSIVVPGYKKVDGKIKELRTLVEEVNAQGKGFSINQKKEENAKEYAEKVLRGEVGK